MKIEHFGDLTRITIPHGTAFIEITPDMRRYVQIVVEPEPTLPKRFVRPAPRCYCRACQLITNA